jgi:dihydroorotate dehydrogenase
MHRRLQGRIPLIGVGGILDGSDAAEKLDAGASLVQLYSGLIYRGPALVNECVDEIRRQRGAAHVD